jgi:hypothetical protein
MEIGKRERKYTTRAEDHSYSDQPLELNTSVVTGRRKRGDSVGVRVADPFCDVDAYDTSGPDGNNRVEAGIANRFRGVSWSPSSATTPDADEC